jgi:hypothetical protein
MLFFIIGQIVYTKNPKQKTPEGVLCCMFSSLQLTLNFVLVRLLCVEGTELLCA